MTDHADTIRRAREAAELLGTYTGTEREVERIEAVTDLAESLLAERQQAIDALREVLRLSRGQAQPALIEEAARAALVSLGEANSDG